MSYFLMVPKEGVSLKRIASTLETIGFNVVGGRVTTKQVIEKALLPIILHWEQNHFIVLFKIKNKKGKFYFYVSDPAVGLIVYSQDEFNRKWLSTRTNGEDKGIALFINNNRSVKDNDNPGKHEADTSSMKILIPYFLKYKYFFLQLIFGYVLISMLQLLFPYLTKSIVDVGIKSSNLNFIILILVAQLVLLVSSSSVRIVNNWITLHISTRINISLVSDFLIKLMKLPMDFFDSKKVGDIVQRIGDHRRIETFITSQSLSLFYSIITMIVFSAVLFSYNMTIFIVFLGFSIVYFLWLLLFMKKRKVLDYKNFGISAKSNNVTYQLISGMQESKLQSCTQKQRWNWEDIRVDLFDVSLESLKLSQIQDVGATFINESKNIIITFLAASLVIDSKITLGMMLAIQYIIGQLSVPVVQIANYVYNIQDVKISLERINEIKNKKDENSNRDKIISSDDKTIRISNLNFSYEGTEKYVLKNINLTIRHNEKIAIVGSSGSGKTTLLKLILQYYNIKDGTISDTVQNIV